MFDIISLSVRELLSLSLTYFPYIHFQLNFVLLRINIHVIFLWLRFKAQQTSEYKAKKADKVIADNDFSI